MTRRAAFVVGGIVVCSVCVPVWAQHTMTVERHVDRPGMDYRDFVLDEADPGLCRQACSDDAECRAYTYVKPGVQGPKARCWLKRGVPGPKANDNCVSGVKTTHSIVKTMESNVDRPGMNYRDFDLDSAKPNLCRRICEDDPRCRAFTYVKPGVQGPKARCWLKHGVPGPKRNKNCISGVKKLDPALQNMESNVDRPGMNYRDFDLDSPDPVVERNRAARGSWFGGRHELIVGRWHCGPAGWPG